MRQSATVPCWHWSMRWCSTRRSSTRPTGLLSRSARRARASSSISAQDRFPTIGKPQQIRHCVEREAQVAAPPMPLKMTPPVGLIVATRSRRRRQQTDPFVVANGFNLGTNNSREFVNSKCLGEHS
jgi:hypothetical protein